MKNLLLIARTPEGYTATYGGPHAAEIEALFHTRTLPLPWTAQADPAKVLADVAARFPDAAVKLAEVR